MSNSSSGLYKTLTSGFSSGPEDVFEQVDLSKKVDIDVSTDGAEIELGDLASFTIDEDGFDWRNEPPTVDEIQDNLYEEAFDATFSALSEVTGIDTKEFKDVYDAIEDDELLAYTTDKLMDYTKDYMEAGNIDGVAQIVGVVGSDVVDDYFPNPVTDTLRNYDLDDYGSEVAGNNINSYCNDNFLPTLDDIDDTWDDLEDVGDGVKDLNTYGASSIDAKLVFSGNDKKNRLSVVGWGRTKRALDDLVKIYRPLVQERV